MVLADLDPADGSRILVTRTSPLQKDLFNRIPGTKWSHRQQAWHLPLGWAGCLALRSTFREDLEVGPGLAEWATSEYRERVQPCLDLRMAYDAEGSETLYGYQRAGVAFLSLAKRGLLADEMGLGKAQPLSEPVLTPSGFKPMGDIKQGDYVIGSDGSPTQVFGTYRQGVRPVYKVTFKDGGFTYADEEHLWRVASATMQNRGKSVVLTTRELIERGITGSVDNRNGKQYPTFSIPLLSAPVEFEEQENELPVEPYTLGVLLGDGYVKRHDISFCTMDQDMVNRVVASLPSDTAVRIKHNVNYRNDSDVDVISVGFVRAERNTPNSVLVGLRELGVTGHGSGSKFVPEAYLYASVEARTAVLQGLMDTDGSCDKGGNATFSSASLQLAQDVVHLVRSLGGLATLQVKPPKKGGNFNVHGVAIKMPDNSKIFHIKRKRELARQNWEKYPPRRLITGIEYSHDEETQCIAVAAPDHLYVTRDFIVTHNTRQALMTLQQLYMQGTNPFPTLIVAPNSTKIGWKREAETVWPGLEVVVVKGSAAQRRKQLETPAHIYVMNWESLRGHSRLAPYGSISLARCPECGGEDPRITHVKCEVHPRELNQIKFNSVIADEIHRSKSPTAKQTRALWSATGAADIRIALTGTPIANAPDDLWTVLHWLSPEEWPSRTKFIDRFLDISYNAFGAATVTGVKASMRDEFFGAVDPRMRRMSKDAVLPFLPPKVYERRDVEMAPKQAKAYKQMVEQMIAELDDGNLLVTTSPLVRMTRLLQFASSYAELEREWNEDRQEWDEHVKLIDPSCKINAFIDDLTDFGDESVVVFAVSRQLIEMLSEKLTKLKIAHGLITGAQNADERQHWMDEFQAGRVKYMLCTIAAGGTGITLTRGSTAVFLQRSWSMIDNTQAEARVHRIGSEQHETIRILDYVTAGTVEEAVHVAVEQKSNRLEEILRDKELLRKVVENGGDW